MAATLRYLTVQDVLWINLQATRRINSYRYADLEEATYYQYAYGDSEELVDQAARFMAGFLKKAPFESGNEPTAFVAVLAFLRLNHREVSLEDSSAADWFEQARSVANSALAAVVREEEHDHHENVRGAVTSVLQMFPGAIKSLGGHPLEIVADGAIH